MNIKFDSDTWSEITDIEVVDPDGWDRSSAANFDKSWNEFITLDEFWNRLCVSTTRRGFVSYHQMLNIVKDKIVNYI